MKRRKRMRYLGYVGYSKIEPQHDNLHAAIKQYNPEKWRKLRYAQYTKRFPMRRLDVPANVTFKTKVEIDDYSDYSHLGQFTMKWEPGAIAHDRHDNRTMDWFIPANTEEDHFRALHKMGYSRGVARQMAQTYVAQDHAAAVEYCAHIVTVKMYLAGEYVDHATLCGIDSLDNGYLEEVENELKEEILSRHAWLTVAEYAYA